MPHLDSTLETRHQVRLEDLDCYATCIPQEILYLTDSQVKVGSPSFRFYAELVHKSENKPVLLADFVVCNPSLTALSRVLSQSSLGSEYCVASYWIPTQTNEEPF